MKNKLFLILSPGERSVNTLNVGLMPRWLPALKIAIRSFKRSHTRLVNVASAMLPFVRIDMVVEMREIQSLVANDVDMLSVSIRWKYQERGFHSIKLTLDALGLSKRECGSSRTIDNFIMTFSSSCVPEILRSTLANLAADHFATKVNARCSLQLRSSIWSLQVYYRNCDKWAEKPRCNISENELRLVLKDIAAWYVIDGMTFLTYIS